MATGQDRNSDPTDISQVLDSLGQMIGELDACVKEVDNCDQSGSQLEDADLRLEALLADTDEFEDDEQLCLIPRNSQVQSLQPSVKSQAKSQQNHQVNSNKHNGAYGSVANAKGTCGNPTPLRTQQNLYSAHPGRPGHKGAVNEVALADEIHGSFKRVGTGNPNPGNPTPVNTQQNLYSTPHGRPGHKGAVNEVALAGEIHGSFKKVGMGKPNPGNPTPVKMQQNLYSAPPGCPGHKGAVNEVALAGEIHGSFKKVGTGNPNSCNPTPLKTQQNLYSAPPGHPGHKGAVNEVALANETHGSFKKVAEGSSTKAAVHTQSCSSAVKAQPNYYVAPSELGLGSTSNGKVLGRGDHGSFTRSDGQPNAGRGYMSQHPGNHQKKTQEEGSLAQIPVKVYSEDSVPVTLIVTPNMTTREACHKLILLNKVDVDPQWVLVERLTDLGLERNLEDHEDVMSTLMTWAPGSSNKFLFRKDYSKYHFFTHTSNYFPPHLLDSELADKAVTEQAQKAKRILNQKLFSTCARVPEIEGCLHFKDFGKKSWNKKFFFLRGSGLYCSTKGKSKASKDLECYVQFDGANLYSILNPKKSHKSPTEFSFCIVPLRAKEMKELKCFCADDEKTAMSWVMAVRLAKYGPQLRHNYDDMIRKLSKLTKYREQAGKKVIHESEERTLETVQVIKEGQVAMDFTGERGKVITDSQEIKEVAVTRQKVKITRRISSQNFIPTHTVEPGCQFKNEPWYHGRITREHSLELLMAAGVVDGLFLVRESSSVTGVFVLTFCMNRKVYHCQLVQDIGHGNETFFSLGKGPGFRTLQELVCFYQTKPLNGVSLALRTPCPKQPFDFRK